MAAVRRTTNYAVNKRHVRSKMGCRPQEVRAVGAWVQPEGQMEQHHQDAVVSARLEEERLRQVREKKERKLDQFQYEVRRRVIALDKLKKQELLEKSYRAVEVERNVVSQSALAAEKTTPRKNSCTLRQDSDFNIQKAPSHVNTQSSNVISDGEDASLRKFEEHSQQIRSFTKQARDRLTSRRVVVDHPLHFELPGGEWKDDVSASQHPAERDVEGAVISYSGDEEITPETEEIRGASPESVEVAVSRSVRFGHVTSEICDEYSDIPPRQSGPRASRSGLQRAPSVPDIYPGVAGEEERVRAQNQRVMYRRLFMDIEREQVKETQRQKEHAKRINKLKRAKEQERREVEDRSQRLLEPRDPITGRTPAQSFRDEVREEQKMIRETKERELRIQKTRETERFLDALKVNLRDKVAGKKLELPPLCCCAATLWETNPDTCANNCVFYRNPKAYVRALQSLLISCDVA